MSQPGRFFNNPNEKVWFLANVGVPLVPIIFAAIIRYGSIGIITWDTISAPDLAISIALLSLLINQSLIRSERTLDTDEKKQEAHSEAILYLFIMIGFFGLHFLMVHDICILPFLEVDGSNYISGPLNFWRILTYFLSLVTIYQTTRTQKGFKLKASLI